MSDYQEIKILKAFGEIETRYYPHPERRYGVIFVGGVGGGWDTPAADLYPRLCTDLLKDGISSLRVRFRNPIDLERSVEDVLAGIGFLAEEKVTNTALVGHSFGGAVVIRAAAQSDYVKTVITLSTQAYGTAPVTRLDLPILLIHGSEDKTLAPFNSETVYALAKGPKRIEIFPGAGHGLEDAAEAVYRLVRDWIAEKVKS